MLTKSLPNRRFPHRCVIGLCVGTRLAPVDGWVETRALAIERIRVVVAENSAMACQLVAQELERQGLEVVGTCQDSAELLSFAAQQTADVFLVSSTLAGAPGKGCEAVRALRSQCADCVAVVSLESSSRAAVVDAFRAGARGVFCKQGTIKNLRKCIECVHAGQIWANREELSFALDALASAPTMLTSTPERIDLLSKRERDVVQCLAEGLTNQEIGRRLGLSPHTVKNYLFRIFDKVGVSSRVELLFLLLSKPAETPSTGALVVQSPFDACRKAAEAGSPSAQLRLSQMYREGVLVTRDALQAYVWLLISERTNADLAGQIRTAKGKLAASLGKSEVRDAEIQASKWLGQSGFQAQPIKVMPIQPARPLQKLSSA